MRNSFVGPIVLIVLGAIFLANNLRVDISAWRLIADYWPYLLIAWGFIRLAEIGYLASRNQPLPRRGMGGGEWAVIVIVTLIASGINIGNDVRDRVRTGRANFRGMQIFGETFEYPVSANAACPKAPRIIVENRRGNVRLVGADADAVVVSGHSTIFGMDKSEADRISGRMKLEVLVQGDQVIIRTNQESAGSDNKVESDLEVRVPKGSTVECRGTRGDFDVSQITGNFEVNSENAGVRGQDIGGNVRIDLRRSDVVRLVRVKGNVDVKGSRASEIEIDQVAGQVTVDGQFTGSIDFRRIDKALRFTSNATTLSIDRIRGRAHMSDGDLEVEDIQGPLKLRCTRSKDVRISGYAAPIEIDINRGDIELSPDTATLATMAVKTESGSITLHVPENAKFDLEARSRRGELDNRYGSPLNTREENHGGVIRGGNGGPRIGLETYRGSMTITRGGSVSSRMETPKATTTPPMPPKMPVPVER